MTSFHPSDPAWLAAAQQGDKEAFAKLMQHNQGRVYAVCLRITRSTELAREATQDAFLSAWRSLAGFRADASFDSWVYRIAVNASLRILRRLPPTVDTPAEELLPRFKDPGMWADQPPTWAQGPDRQLWLKRIREAIETALPTLPDSYRVPYILREIEELPIKEIGEILHLSLPTVKTRVHRARLMLRALIHPSLAAPDQNGVTPTPIDDS